MYVALTHPDLKRVRVRLRVARGGHNVPDEAIRRRYIRGLENAPEVLRLADRAVVVDNSGSNHARKLTVRRGQIIWRAAALPEWVEEIARKLEGHSG